MAEGEEKEALKAKKARKEELKTKSEEFTTEAGVYKAKREAAVTEEAAKLALEEKDNEFKEKQLKAKQFADKVTKLEAELAEADTKIAGTNARDIATFTEKKAKLVGEIERMKKVRDDANTKLETAKSTREQEATTLAGEEDTELTT